MEPLAKTLLDAFEVFFPNGDYGKSYRQVIYLHGHLADWYFTLNETRLSLFHLQKSAELAARFDALPEVLKHTSPLLEGFKIEKGKVPVASGSVMSERIKVLIGKYSYSDEFKNSDEFKEILKILD